MTEDKDVDKEEDRFDELLKLLRQIDEKTRSNNCMLTIIMCIILISVFITIFSSWLSSINFAL
ncbi:MAG: hypothetical protein ACFFD7_10585 [Candidatus Thorarchaeota archaeon]